MEQSSSFFEGFSKLTLKQKILFKFLSTWALHKTIKTLFSHPKSVVGKIAVITGAASGIGKGLAKKLAENGAKVIIADLNYVKASEVAQEICKLRTKAGLAQALAVQCDVTSYSSVQSLAQTVKSHFGPTSILINNAGIVFGKSLTDLTIANIELTFKVNVLSHFYTIKEFLPDMLKANEGHIVTIASLGGFVGSDKLVDYSASKFACVGLDEALRSELRIMGSNVKTTCVNPYYVDTGMFEGVSTPIRILKPEFVVEKIFQAIVWEKQVLFLPRKLEYMLRAARVLPVEYYDFLVNVLKFNRSMDSFVGRGKL